MDSIGGLPLNQQGYSQKQYSGDKSSDRSLQLDLFQTSEGQDSGILKPEKTAKTDIAESAPSSAAAESQASKPVSAERTENFAISMGNSQNYFFRSPDVSAQVVTYEKPEARLLFCFPEGNSGIELKFSSRHPENRGLSLSLAVQPSCIKTDLDHDAVAVGVGTNKKKIVLDGIELDSVRTIRDETEGPEGLKNRFENRDLFKERKPDADEWDVYNVEVEHDDDSRILHLREKAPGGEYEYYADITLPDTVRATIDQKGRVTLTSTDDRDIVFIAAGSTSFENLHPIFSEEILNDRSREYQESLHEKAASPTATDEDKRKASMFDEYLRNLSFLSFKEKFLAGGWRYLTYFGRDSILSLMMLKNAVKPDVYQSALRSILDRMSDEGRVAHEEDIGSQAADDRMKQFNALYEGGRANDAREVVKSPTKGVYDYKMVDDDILFPIMMEMYLNDPAVPSEDKVSFLQRSSARGDKNLEVMLANWNYDIGKAEEYRKQCGRKGKSSTDATQSLIRIKEGEHVGDWRDSNIGLGGGVYPGSVNVDLVANSLKSIDRMIRSGLVSLDELREIAGRRGYEELGNLLGTYSEGHKSMKMDGLIHTWERARERFSVKLPVNEVRARLRSYLNEFPLSAEEKQMLLATEISKGCSVKDFVENRKTPGVLDSGLTYYALSLDEKGKQIPVMNSDSCFRLMTGEPSPAEISDILKTVTLPYPLGLMSDVGMFVSNPIYTQDRDLWKKMDRNGYHGTVVWSWPNALMEKGLMKQIQRFSSPEYSGDAEAQKLVKDMVAALKSLRGKEKNVGDMINFELWTYRVEDGRMKAHPYGQDAGSETESNAIQLWSTVGLSVMEDCDRLLEGLEKES